MRPINVAHSDILCAPAGYFMDGGLGGSEPLWAHEIVRQAGLNARSVTAVTGYVEMADLPSNVRVVTVGGRRGENFVHPAVSLRFLMQYGSAAIREFIRCRFSLVHHVLPFGMGRTVNPLLPFLGDTPLVVGPVQGLTHHEQLISASPHSGFQGSRRSGRYMKSSGGVLCLVDSILEPLNRKLLERADAIVAVSGEAVEALPSSISRDKVFVITPGVDVRRFCVRPRHEGSRMELLSVCYLTRRKRVDVVLRAYRRLLDSGWDVGLTIVGNGPEEERLREHARSLAVEDQIRWMGFVPNHAMCDVYAKADVFCSASEHESFGMVMAEALASGIPVVAVSNTGSRTVVTNERRGTLVSPGNDAAMADAIAALASDREALEKRREVVREEAVTAFDWSIIGKRYAAVYERVLQGDSSAGTCRSFLPRSNASQ